MFQVLQTPNLGFGFQVFDMWLQNLATQPHQNELGRRLIIPASTSKVVSEGLIYLHTIMAMEFLRMELNDPRTMAIVLIYLFSPYPSYSVTIPHWWDLNSHCHENSYIYIISLSLQFPCSSISPFSPKPQHRMWTCQVASARRSIWRRPLCPVPWIRWPSPIWPSQWLWKAGWEWRWHE